MDPNANARLTFTLAPDLIDSIFLVLFLVVIILNGYFLAAVPSVWAGIAVIPLAYAWAHILCVPAAKCARRFWPTVLCFGCLLVIFILGLILNTLTIWAHLARLAETVVSVIVAYAVAFRGQF